MPDVARIVLAAAGVFTVCGLGVVRLLLPADLRAREALWVLPVGACSCGIAMTALGFVGVPFKVSLALIAIGGAAFSAWSLRRTGRGIGGARDFAWTSYLALLLAAIALVPIFVFHFVSVVGDGSDAHLAAGTAQFLQHSYPTSVNPAQPIDQMPLVWRSKFPIYYVLGAVSTLSGLESWQALSPLIAVMLGLAAVGIFLVARELLGAGLAVAACAMAIAGLDRAVLQTGTHPYFNQTWGYFTVPFALILAWWVTRSTPAGQPAADRRGAAVLLALFLAVGAFAYPLALPIPVAALASFWWLERRARRRRGEAVAGLRDLPLSRRSLWWALPLAVLLAVPALGVLEKAVSAARVLLPGHPLDQWAGDLSGFVATHRFFGLLEPWMAWPGIVALAALALLALRDRPRSLACGLAGVLAAALLAGVYLRQRDHGWYFHFKLLAFVGPILLACAVAGAARLRAIGAVAIVLLIVSGVLGARRELRTTGQQLSVAMIDLRSFARAVPPGRSIRLDTSYPAEQLWVAYFLAARPLCSQLPLLGTSYPHVPVSRRADYVLVSRKIPLPEDATGPALRQNVDFALYRMRPGVPGPERCSRRMVQSVTRITGAL